MAAGRLKWDNSGEKYWSTGSRRGVLYVQDDEGSYPEGIAWNGFRGFTENPTGAEPTKLYANDTLYGVLKSAEELEGTLTAYTYPPEFAECDGSIIVVPGVTVAQQGRKSFGFCYRTSIGNDVSEEVGYQLHLVYGCSASPSEKAYQSTGDSPEVVEFSWDITTTPVDVADHGDKSFKPTSLVIIDSRNVNAEKLKSFEDILYGKDASTGSDPSDAVKARLPLPNEVFEHFAAA